MINWKDKNGYYKKGNDSKLYYTVEIKQCYDPENDIYDLLEVDSTAPIEEIKNVYCQTKNNLEERIKKGETFLKKILADYDNAWKIVRDDKLRTPYNEHRFKCNSKRSNKIVNYTVKIEQCYDPNCDYCDIFNIKSNTKEDAIEEKFKNTITNLEKDTQGLPATVIDSTLNQCYDGWNIFKDAQLKEAYFNARKTYKDQYCTKKGTNRTKGIKVTGVESSDLANEFKNVGIGLLVGLPLSAIVIILILNWNKIFNKQADKDLKIKKNKATIEHFIENEDLNNEIGIEPDPLYDVNYFDDINDDEKIHARAVTLNEFLVASNVNNVTIEELEDQIRFINGTYPAATNDEAYDMLNKTLETWATYGGNLGQGANFAGGVVSENGIHQTVPLVGMLPVTSEHYDFMVETSELWTNVLTAQDRDTKYYAAIEYLKQATELKQGLLVDKTNTRLGYMNLEPNEGFIYGIMLHIAYPHIVSSLSPDYVIPIQDNNGNVVYFGIQETWFFYNPQCNENDNEMNPWYHFANELVQDSLIVGSDNISFTLTPDDKGNN